MDNFFCCYKLDSINTGTLCILCIWPKGGGRERGRGGEGEREGRGGEGERGRGCNSAICETLSLPL